MTLWTALRPSKHLCRTGVNGVVARVAGKGRGGQGGSTNSPDITRPKTCGHVKMHQGKLANSISRETFWGDFGTTCFLFWMVRANMWDPCWCHMVNIDKANLFVSYLFLIYYVIYCNLYMYTYKPMFSLSSCQSLKNIPNCFGVMPSCPCIAS